jgi:hypothetical protein
MKLKIGISLALMLLIVSSTFTVVGTPMKLEQERSIALPIEVSKTAWDGNDWVEEVIGYYDEIVVFNITITYHKNCEDGLYASDIILTDTLPSFLEYAGNANYEYSYICNNIITWNLSMDYGVYLVDGDSISIGFDTKVIDYGEGVNHAEVDAYESGCSWPLYGEDNATITIVDPIVVEKEVYDSDAGEWVDELPGPVKKVNPINFRITITFNGYYNILLMKNMIVNDYLPECCLDYAYNETFTYPDSDLFEDPDIIVSPDLKHVKYDWTNKLFNLFSGQSVIIEFETKVADYCYSTVIDIACVDLYNWPTHLADCDNATVNCYPPDSTIQKKVWDPVNSEWVEEISIYLDDTVRFRIDLAYYGNYDLTNVSILDELHFSMEYAGNADPTETDVSGNLVWWNFTEPLEDNGKISIEFDAHSIGGTGSGSGINIATITAYENGEPFIKSDTAGVIVKVNHPPSSPDVGGDNFGKVGQELTFHAAATDPDGDDILYMFDWGDGTYSSWLGPNPSGQEIVATNSWDSPGIYSVKAKAKDTSLGFESDWSYYPLSVKIVVPTLNVTIKSGISLSINIKIENSGEIDVSGITWNLTVKRIGLFKRTLLQKNGNISMLPVDGTQMVTASPTGFGAFNVEIKVEAPDIGQIVVSKEGLIIWKIILL